MAEELLKGLKVAILVTDGFEQVELTEPRKALDEAGAETRVVSPKAERVRGWKSTDWGDEVQVDAPLDQAKPEDFDALLLPGGVMNPDSLQNAAEGCGVRQSLLRGGQAGGGDLPRALDGSRDRRGPRAASDILAVAQDGSEERRGGLGGQAGGRRPETGHQPQAR